MLEIARWVGYELAAVLFGRAAPNEEKSNGLPPTDRMVALGPVYHFV